VRSLCLSPQSGVGPSISSSVVQFFVFLLVCISVPVLAVYFCPSSVRVVATFSGTIFVDFFFWKICLGKHIFTNADNGYIFMYYILLFWRCSVFLLVCISVPVLAVHFCPSSVSVVATFSGTIFVIFFLENILSWETHFHKCTQGMYFYVLYTTVLKMFRLPSGLYFSVCLGSLFLSILYTCCSHFFWYNFREFFFENIISWETQFHKFRYGMYFYVLYIIVLNITLWIRYIMSS